MNAVRRNFTNSLEPIIYWDASYTISYIIDTELYHNECLSFRNRLKSEEILSVGSDLVYNELGKILNAFVGDFTSLYTEPPKVG